MALTLTSAIGPTDRVIAITGTVPDSIEAGYEFRIDDERFVLTTFALHEVQYPGWTQMDPNRNSWVVRRGVTASHSGGASIKGAVDAFVSAATETPPTPFASSGGAGGVSVDNTVDAPVDVTTIVAPGATFDGDSADLSTFVRATVSVTLTDAQIKVLPTTSPPFEILAPEAGFIFAPIYAVLLADLQETYTGIDGAAASMVIYDHVGGSNLLTVVQNDGSLDDVSALLGEYGPPLRNYVVLLPSYSPTAGLISARTVANLESTSSLNLYVTNDNPSTDFTGGDPANTLTVTVVYVKIPVS